MPNEKPSESNRNSGASSAHFELAKARVSKIDAKSDQSDAWDEELRQEALKFIEKECLNLPDKEFMALLSKIEDALRRKDAEISTVRERSQIALKEISEELSLLPLSNFDTGVANPRSVAEYLSNAVSTTDKMDGFEKALRRNPECLMGFVRNWNERHPVRKELEKMWLQGGHAIARLDNHKSSEEATLQRNGSLEGMDERIEKGNAAISKFKKIIGDGFPNLSEKNSVDELVALFEDIEGSRRSEPILILTDDPKNTLAFIVQWAKQPNPMAEAMRTHPNEDVRYALVALDAAYHMGMTKYGYEPNCPPRNFSDVVAKDLKRFENRYGHAQETKAWNAECRSFLTEKWNALIKARTEGNAVDSAKIGAEIDKFFQGDFRKMNEQVNSWFFWLVPEQQPDSYKEFQSIATTKMLFAAVRATFDDGSESPVAKAADAETGAKLRRYDENFRDMLRWGAASLLVDDGKGWLESKNMSNFVEEVSQESDLQAMKYPEGVARYLSITYARCGKEAFAQCLRSDFGSKYDAIVLKFADVAGYVSKNGSTNPEAWSKIERTLIATDMETYGFFQDFLKSEVETILADKKAIGEEDSGTVRKLLEKKGTKEQIDKVLETIRGKGTKEQFNALLREFPNLTHGEVEAIFTEISRRSKWAAEAHGREAERILPKTELMEYVPGFVVLKRELAIRPERETVKEAERRNDLLKRLQESNRDEPDVFYQKFKDDADAIVRILDEYASKYSAYKGDCENLSAWFRHKKLSGEKFKESVTQQGVAETSRKESAVSGPNSHAGNSTEKYLADINGNSVLAEKLLSAKEQADALEASGRTAEAAELRKMVFGSADWSLSSEIPNLEKAAKGVEKAEKDERFRLGEKSRGEAFGNKTPDAAGEMRKFGTTPSEAAGLIVSQLQVGREVRVPLEGVSADVRVLKTQNAAEPYRVSVDGKESFSCTDKNLAANLQMADLLSRNGLAFLAPVSGELLRRSSVAKGNLATAADGDFGDREKRELLSAAAKALKIGDFPHASTDLSEMSARFGRISRDENTSARELGIRNGVLDESGNLKNREEFLASAA